MSFYIGCFILELGNCLRESVKSNYRSGRYLSEKGEIFSAVPTIVLSQWILKYFFVLLSKIISPDIFEFWNLTIHSDLLLIFLIRKQVIFLNQKPYIMLKTKWEIVFLFDSLLVKISTWKIWFWFYAIRNLLSQEIY